LIGLEAPNSRLVDDWESGKAHEDDMRVALTAWILVTDIQKLPRNTLRKSGVQPRCFPQSVGAKHMLTLQARCWLWAFLWPRSVSFRIALNDFYGSNSTFSQLLSVDSPDES